jgi:hypothetical protein
MGFSFVKGYDIFLIYINFFIQLTSELRKTFESKFLIIENRLISLATDFFETLRELVSFDNTFLCFAIFVKCTLRSR